MCYLVLLEQTKLIWLDDTLCCSVEEVKRFTIWEYENAQAHMATVHCAHLKKKNAIHYRTIHTIARVK